MSIKCRVCGVHQATIGGVCRIHAAIGLDLATYDPAQKARFNECHHQFAGENNCVHCGIARAIPVKDRSEGN